MEIDHSKPFRGVSVRLEALCHWRLASGDNGNPIFRNNICLEDRRLTPSPLLPRPVPCDRKIREGRGMNFNTRRRKFDYFRYFIEDERCPSFRCTGSETEEEEEEEADSRISFRSFKIQAGNIIAGKSVLLTLVASFSHLSHRWI